MLLLQRPETMDGDHTEQASRSYSHFNSANGHSLLLPNTPIPVVHWANIVTLEKFSQLIDSTNKLVLYSLSYNLILGCAPSHSLVRLQFFLVLDDRPLELRNHVSFL